MHSYTNQYTISVNDNSRMSCIRPYRNITFLRHEIRVSGALACAN